jgi:epsin
MGELADYTFHVQAYSLVMGMLWRRLNDHGRNWRHVYKSLIVLEYIIKGGSERVTQQCRDNMFSIQTLKDFQYVDKDGKDQGANVREKAKQLVTLLKDDRKLKEERQRAHQARERHQALGSDSPVPSRGRSPNPGKKVTFGSTEVQGSTDENGKRVQPVEQARPGNESEEELQLKLALQLSKQQADDEATLRRQEEESLTAALALSVVEHKQEPESKEETPPPSSSDLLLDLDSSLKDPWGAQPSEPLPTYDSLVNTNLVDPWSVGGAPVKPPAASGANLDPWGAGGVVTSTAPPTQSLPANDPWNPSSSNPQNNPFDLSDLGLPLPPASGPLQVHCTLQFTCKPDKQVNSNPV